MTMHSMKILLSILLYLLLPCQTTRAQEPDPVREIKESFQSWKEETDRDFQAFKDRQDAEWKAFVADIKARWNEFEASTKPVFAEYPVAMTGLAKAMASARIRPKGSSSRPTMLDGVVRSPCRAPRWAPARP